MDLNKALDLPEDEQRSLPVEDKVQLTEAAWDQLDDESKGIAVYMSALAILQGRAEFPVTRKIFELADRDGIDTPPEWERVIDEAEAEQELMRALAELFGDLADEDGMVDLGPLADEVDEDE
jgi:hypothetical protein